MDENNDVEKSGFRIGLNKDWEMMELFHISLFRYWKGTLFTIVQMNIGPLFLDWTYWFPYEEA